MADIPRKLNRPQEAVRTPLPRVETTTLINHLNEEHQDNLIMIVQALTETRLSRSAQVIVQNIFAEGLQVQITTEDNLNKPSTSMAMNNTDFFIHFIEPMTDSDALTEQYIALIQWAGQKLGRPSLQLREQRFTVTDSYFVSPNMLRLVLNTSPDTPLDQAGYAYLFDLNIDGMFEQQSDSTDKPRRQCYYTLRKAWLDSESERVKAWVDVFIHGDTPGGNWAKSLTNGMKITSQREFPERIDHLNSGQCLLIADETSLPTLARLVETWQNPQRPILMVITQDPSDIDYLNDIESIGNQLSNPKNNHYNSIREQLTVLHIVNDSAINLADTITAKLAEYLQATGVTIDKVWGALEASQTKSLRRQLKPILGLSRQDMVLKVYWRKQ